MYTRQNVLWDNRQLTMECLMSYTKTWFHHYHKTSYKINKILKISIIMKFENLKSYINIHIYIYDNKQTQKVCFNVKNLFRKYMIAVVFMLYRLKCKWLTGFLPCDLELEETIWRSHPHCIPRVALTAGCPQYIRGEIFPSCLLYW